MIDRQTGVTGRTCPRVLISILVSCLAGVCQAQFVVRLNVEHSKLLQYEPLNAFVSIENTAGVRLPLGRRGAGFRFLIQKERDLFAARLNERDIIGRVTLDPGQKHDFIRDISLWYDVASAGSYTLAAAVDWQGDTFVSNRVRIDVMNGLPISSVSRMLPGSDKVWRRYSLCYLAREGNEHLFLRIDDDATKFNYGVFDLGQIVRLFKPALRFDDAGEVKVIHQSGYDRFTYSVLKVDRDRVKFVDQRYYRGNGKPCRPENQLAPPDQEEPAEE
jgi:hypothetical protein